MDDKTKNVLRAYCARGFKLFPIKRETKRPAIKDNLNQASDDLDQLIKWEEKFPGCNWGLSLARSGLVAVDVDFKHGGMEAWRALIEEQGEPETLRATSGSGASHYLFKAEEGTKYKGKIRDGIDIKFNGYVVVFPSVHPETGARYRWDNWKSHKPTAYPEWLAKYIEKTTLTGKANPTYKFGDDYLQRLVSELKKFELDYHEWVQAGMALHAASPDDQGLALFLDLTQGESYEPGDEEKAQEKWESFKRDDEDGAISSLTLGFLVRQKGGVVPNPHFESDKELFKKAKIDAFETWAEAAAEGFIEDESDPERLVCSSKASIVKHFNRKGYAYLGEGEQRFPVIKLTDAGTGVLQLKPMTTRGLIESTAEFTYKYLKVMATDVKMVYEPAAKVWLESKNKRRFMNPTFNPDPGAPLKKGSLNLFTGFCVDPVSRPTSKVLGDFIGMIHNVLCGGDKRASDWLLDFLAHNVQRPWEKPTVVPVIIGPQGTGKGLLFDGVMRRILGACFTSVKTAKDLTAQFNDELANKLLTIIDEATWRGNKTEDGILKNLTGSGVMKVEIKFGPKYEVENYSRYVITSNNDEAVAIETSNRRYFVIECSTERAGDTTYFNPFWESLKSGELASEFMGFLNERDISNFNHAAIPKGNTRGEMAKLTTGGAVMQFWGDLFSDESDPKKVWFDEDTLLTGQLYGHFKAFVQEINHWEKGVSIQKFWRETRKIIPILPKQKDIRVEGSVRKVIKIDPESAMKSFCAKNEIRVPELFRPFDFVENGDFDF